MSFPELKKSKYSRFDSNPDIPSSISLMGIKGFHFDSRQVLTNPTVSSSIPDKTGQITVLN